MKNLALKLATRPSGANVILWNKMVNHLKAEIAALDINTVFTKISNFAADVSLHVKNDFFATIFYLNTEYAIAQGSYLNNLYYIKPLAYVSVEAIQSGQYVKVGTFDPVRFIDDVDAPHLGVLELYQSRTNPSIFKYKVALLVDDIILTTYPYLSDFWTLFNHNKPWVSTWANDFTNDIANFINNLNFTDKSKLHTIISSWDDAVGEDLFRALKNSIFKADGTLSEFGVYLRSLEDGGLGKISAVKEWGKLYNGGIPAAYCRRLPEFFDGNSTPRIALKEGNPIDGEVELTFNWNGEEITEIFKVIDDAAEGGLRFRFKYCREKNSAIEVVQGHPFNGNSSQHVIPVNSSGDTRTVLSSHEIQYMQDGISNHTGDRINNRFTLKNAYEWSEQGVPANLPPLEVWKSLDPATPGIWTLNHRRLAAYKLAGEENVKIVWASQELVEDTFWEMTTKTVGKDMYVKVWLEDVVENGVPNTYFRFSPKTPEEIAVRYLEKWNIKTYPDGSTKLYKPNGDEIDISTEILPYLN